MCDMSELSTKQAYEEICNKELTDCELEQVSADLTGFFALLIEIQRDSTLHQKEHEEF